MSESTVGLTGKDKFGTKGWFTNHKLRSIMLAFVALVIVSSMASGGNSTKSASSVDTQQSTVKSAATPAKSVATSATTTVSATPSAPAETVSQKNAVKSAKQYLDTGAFSHDGLIDQLEYEKYSAADATYGVDNSGADWNSQAAKSAKQYLSTGSFSRQELIDQLVYEKFTTDQATYGVNSVGL